MSNLKQLLAELLNIIKTICIAAFDDSKLVISSFCESFAPFPLNTLSELVDDALKISVQRRRSSFDLEVTSKPRTKLSSRSSRRT